MAAWETVTQTSAVPKKLSLAEHKVHVIKLIQKWCSENKENLDLENLNLKENDDFILNIELDENSDPKATIKCKCNRLISLARNDNKIQVSNYYKHLQSNGCCHMKDLLKAEKELKLRQQKQQSPLPVASPSSSHSSISLTQVTDASSVATQTEVPTGSSTVSIRTSQNNGKRRLTTQSQQCSSAKRSRT